MRVLIALGEGLPPQHAGGSQKAALEIATGLNRLGEEVLIAGRLYPWQLSGLGGLVNALTSLRAYAVDCSIGVRTFKYVKEQISFPRILAAAKPDVVLVHAMAAMPIARMVAERNIPLVVYWHDVEFHKLLGSPEALNGRFVANSQFTSSKVREAFNRDSVVIPPTFADPPVSTAGSTDRDRVLFINPVPEKGLQRVLEIAALCPEIDFEFLESWTLDKTARKDLNAALNDLPNVTLTPRQANMAPVYGRAKLLIVPSRWEEAWGRVATEAQANGIPVLATRIGGLPEAVGPGGILFAPDADATQWAQAVRELWSSSGRYAELASAAITHSRRPDVDPRETIRRLRSELSLAIAARRD